MEVDCKRHIVQKDDSITTVRPSQYQVVKQNTMESCPRCGTVRHVRPKSILIGAASPKKRFDGEEKAGYRRLDQLAVDECKPALLKAAPLEQLIDGFYCDNCGLGFVTSDLLQGVERS
jgi:predicted RNA-binding Zn-ribbon protein involved in translation (DUF1610 family)